MAPADSLSGPRAQWGCAGRRYERLGLQGWVQGEARAPEGNQLAGRPCCQDSPAASLGCGPGACGSVAAAWAGPAGRGHLGRGGEEGPAAREGRDAKGSI